MYSRDEKIQILEAFYESGLTLAKAGRTPGWPAKSTMLGWIKEVERGELPLKIAIPKGFAEGRSPHERYSTETKRQAVKLYAMGRRPAEIAKLLGVDCRANIRVWWKKAQKEGKLPKDDFVPKSVDSDIKEKPVTKKKKDIPEEVKALSESELENACLRAVLADLKVGGWDLDSISNRKKTELGERLRQETGRALREIIDFLKISKSSYDYHRRRLGKSDKYANERIHIRKHFYKNKCCYGYRRIWSELRTEDSIYISEKVVRKIMKEEGLVVRYEPKIKRWSSYEGETKNAPENLVKQDFRAALPNFLWLTDITEFSFTDFKCYLSPIIDCFDGMVVSWELSKSPNAELVNTMLDNACRSLRRNEALIIHSDRGAHYRWPGWIQRCNDYGITRSMSRKGCSPDNSACEGFFGRLKNEFFYHRSWQDYTFEEFKAELSEYIEWYNTSRIKKSLGWMSPIEFRASLGLAA